LNFTISQQKEIVIPGGSEVKVHGKYGWKFKSMDLAYGFTCL